jgi:Fic family protein
MHHAGLIQQPMFYISAYLEANRDIYYDKLLAVSRDDDWTGWCVFFLAAVQQQAEDNLKKAGAILDLYNRMKIYFVELTHSQYAIHALDWIFERPIFKSSDFVSSSSIPKPTAQRILNVLKANDLLRTMTESSGSRPAVLAYPALLNVAEGREAF